MSLEQSQGIQALLAAEKASAETINNARKKKAMRLKQAQEEAEAEVARYRQEREGTFQAWITSNSSGSSDLTAGLEKDAKAQIGTIESESAADIRNAVAVLMKQQSDAECIDI